MHMRKLAYVTKADEKDQRGGTGNHVVTVKVNTRDIQAEIQMKEDGSYAFVLSEIEVTGPFHTAITKVLRSFNGKSDGTIDCIYINPIVGEVAV